MEGDIKMQTDLLNSELDRLQKKLTLYQERCSTSEKAVGQKSIEVETYMSLANENEQKYNQTLVAVSRLEREISELKEENRVLLDNKEKSRSVFNQVTGIERELELCKKVSLLIKY